MEPASNITVFNLFPAPAWNAWFPILVTPARIVSSSKILASRNELLPILVQVLGIVYVVPVISLPLVYLPGYCTRVLLELNNTPSIDEKLRLPSSTKIYCNLVVPKNVYESPKLVTLAGIVMVVKLVALKKQKRPKLVQFEPASNVTVVKFEAL